MRIFKDKKANHLRRAVVDNAIHTVPSSADDGTVRIAYEPPANQSSLRRSSRKRTLIIYDDPDDN